jgi:hypothetical protein
LTSPLVMILPIGHPSFCGHSDTKGGSYGNKVLKLETEQVSAWPNWIRFADESLYNCTDTMNDGGNEGITPLCGLINTLWETLTATLAR